jgi:hypothetical protein
MTELMIYEIDTCISIIFSSLIDVMFYKKLQESLSKNKTRSMYPIIKKPPTSIKVGGLYSCGVDVSFYLFFTSISNFCSRDLTSTTSFSLFQLTW